ncbi:unnamed protein product [Heligmosomoides polygyrus]|uniref:HTH_Tnp_Tc3_1 domain-containing protein n=1 Tax=Heligmosomoides polygyrus TaxID=6339 RepID=A0A183G730_HELPZ|nr:unnamed protein product [Heligmosomoides polygyrus]
MYGAECWSATKEAEARLSITEATMLRWTAGVTRMDRIRNDAIRQKFGVAPIADKSHPHGPHPKRCYSAEVRCRADSGQDVRSSPAMVRRRSAWKRKQHP